LLSKETVQIRMGKNAMVAAATIAHIIAAIIHIEDLIIGVVITHMTEVK
jgi:hypothetical protein